MKSILFNTNMVRMILDGRKAQTRQIIKYPPYMDVIEQSSLKQIRYFESFAPYEKDDILYVRETWCKREDMRDGYFDNIPDNLIGFKVDDNGKKQPYFEASVMKWRPSIHMPKEAARLFLRVMDVRTERLQDISIYDLVKEGYGNVGHPIDVPWYEIAKNDFKQYWNKLYKKRGYGWCINPWVWVVEFERVEKPVN